MNFYTFNSILSVFILSLTWLNTYTYSSKIVKHPVILVPGDGGSQFEARLNKPKVIHSWCEKVATEWYPLWLNLELMTPFVVQCTVDNLRLEYDEKTRKTSNSPGVEIRIPGFGNTSTVEWLDASQNPFTNYFYDITENLVKTHKFVRNENIRGVPYDFRKAPNEMDELFASIKTLIEETYENNGKTSAVLIGHSMGNSVTLYFLNHQTQAWKDKYIKSYVSLAGPWAGAVKPLRLMASGDNLGVVVVNPLTARPEQRSMPSTAWLMPSDKYWKEDEILVHGPKRNYTVKDYKEFFTDIDYKTGYEMWKDTGKINHDLEAPGVEIHCLHGLIEKNTPASFVYNKTAENWYDWQPIVKYGDGDGTVNIRSLKACQEWDGKNHGKPVHYQSFDKFDHMGILACPDVIQYISKIVVE